MTTKLILTGKVLLEKSGLENAHRLSLRAGASYPTVEKYINRPETVAAFDGGVLAKLLLNGLGLSQEQAKDLRLGDVFEFVEVDAKDQED